MDARQHLNVIFGPRYRGLISCQYCGHAVASEAPRCPSCGGRPILRPRAIEIILVLFLGIVGFGYYSESSPFLAWAGLAATVLVIPAAYIRLRYDLQRQATRAGPWSL